MRVSKHFFKKVFIVKDKVSFFAKVFMDLFAPFCIFPFFYSIRRPMEICDELFDSDIFIEELKCKII